MVIWLCRASGPTTERIAVMRVEAVQIRAAGDPEKGRVALAGGCAGGNSTAFSAGIDEIHRQWMEAASGRSRRSACSDGIDGTQRKWLKRQITQQKVGGSNPSRRTPNSALACDDRSRG